MIKRIDTVFLEVDNLDEAVSWYCENLGLRLRWKNEFGYAAIEVSETVLTLVENTKRSEQSHMPFNFFTSDIEATYNQLVSKGVKVGKLNSDSRFAHFDFEDLSGNILGFCWFLEE